MYSGKKNRFSVIFRTQKTLIVNWKPLILDSQLAILAVVASDEQLGDTGTIGDMTELCRLIF